MAFNFQRYLAAKRTVDDRALNRNVRETLARAVLPKPDLRIIEVACGIGTMIPRLQGWGLLGEGAGYRGIDTDPTSISTAREAYGDPHVRFERADFCDWPAEPGCDLLVASAFLDLADLDRALPHLHRYLKPGGLAYFPLNFDGLTVFEPAHPQDDAVMNAYHASMDARPTGGSSRTGRRLFTALPETGFEILAAGASDWIVHPVPGGAYPADEAYFLRHILYFFEGSCTGVEGLEGWLAVRRRQVEAGELVYLAHQVDFLAIAR